MTTPSRLRRAIIAAAGAALLTVGVAGAGLAAGGDRDANPGAKGPDAAAVSALFPPGSELQFVGVAPCRIIDTRVSGGALVSGQRTFDATMTNYSTQGGKAGTCNIPDVAVSVQLNLGAISQNGKTSDVRGWATGTSEPTASMLNYNPAGPVANMVTMPLNSSGQFNLKTPGAAHIFADVAGYYVKPLYAAVSYTGSIYQGIQSGVVSVSRVSTGFYNVTFNRDVEQCAASASTITWSTGYDASPDVSTSSDPNTVQVGIVNSSGTFVDEWFTLSLTC